jgi:hypothetical protein
MREDDNSQFKTKDGGTPAKEENCGRRFILDSSGQF